MGKRTGYVGSKYDPSELLGPVLEPIHYIILGETGSIPLLQTRGSHPKFKPADNKFITCTTDMNKLIKKIPSPWTRLFLSTALAVYFYVFMEWLFFVTKSSFMSGMNFFRQVGIFLLTAFALGLPVLGLILLLSGFAAMTRNKVIRNVMSRLVNLIPALIVTGMILILVDNFTYTLFKFGIVSTTGIERAIYAFMFVLILIAVYTLLWGGLRFDDNGGRKPSHAEVVMVCSLLPISIVLAAFKSHGASVDLNVGIPYPGNNGNALPNIILMSTDGLSATHMSVYGYERDTTPNIWHLAGAALVAENAFSVSADTTGSLTAVLTGKFPTETHMYYPPDILTGVDSYQHLPGILKRLGYYTVQISNPYYADAYSRNLLNGFDTANNRSENKTIFSSLARTIGDGGSTYFNYVILQRLTERLQHIFFLSTMVNPYEIVTEPGSGLSTEKQIDKMLSIIDNAKTPFFLQVHMEGTHGPRFSPLLSVFSAGETQDKDWMADFYDDAILDFDQNVNRVFKHLSQVGKLNNTIVVIFSDHGMAWESNTRIPLLIWLPDGEKAGVIKSNVQLVDIAPTILDYLGGRQPDWMSGQSLLKSIPERFIIATKKAPAIYIGNDQFAATRLPPFYEIGSMTLISCDKWFTLDLLNPGLLYGEVLGSTSPCTNTEIPSPEQAITVLLDDLRKNGYDTSAFPQTIPISYIPIIGSP
jgi:arylsulfatase A-like enzyme